MRTLLVTVATAGAMLVAPVSAAGAVDAVAATPAAAPLVVHTSNTVLAQYTLPAHYLGYPQLGLLGQILSDKYDSNIAPPCTGCQITSIVPDLTDTTGRSVDMDTGPMLHHVVIEEMSASDTACPFRLFGSKRLFASGNERTPFRTVPGYGLPVSAGAKWQTVTDLMNYAATPKTVQVRVRTTWVQGQTLKSLTPVWLDESNCNPSYLDVPAGASRQNMTWTSSISGDVVWLSGHTHEYGRHIAATDTTTNTKLCDSRQTQMTMTTGPAKGEVMVMSMSTCTGPAPTHVITHIARGDTISMTSYYNTPKPEPGAMGIMIVYVHEDQPAGARSKSLQVA